LLFLHLAVPQGTAEPRLGIIGLELNKSDSVLNQPLVTTAENRGNQNVAGGPGGDRASGL